MRMDADAEKDWNEVEGWDDPNKHLRREASSRKCLVRRIQSLEIKGGEGFGLEAIWEENKEEEEEEEEEEDDDDGEEEEDDDDEGTKERMSIRLSDINEREPVE